MNTKKLVLAALTVTLLGSGAAFAQGNGNGNSNGHGASNNGNHGASNNGNHGASNNGNNGRGAIASELKWRNAAHASEQAFLNASPDSAVGKLATLRDAAQATAEAIALAGLEPGTEIRAPLDIQADIDLLTAPTRTAEEIAAELTQAIIDNLDTTDLVNELAAAEEYEALVTELEVSEGLADVLAAEAEAGAVVGLDELSDDALDALWDLLNK
jgi:hypothetical protein